MDLFEKFLTFIDALENENVEYILIGGLAVILYGMPRLTQDIDLFVKPDEHNISKLRTALLSLYQDKSINEITLSELTQYSVIRYGTPEGFNIDIITQLGKTFSYEKLEYQVLTFEGHRLRIATPETLFELKKNTPRPVDRSDILFLTELIQKNKGS